MDTYGTVSPHTLIRQHLDYSHWYDRNKLTLKEIHNCQYVACMNPTAGSFTINPRLQVRVKFEEKEKEGEKWYRSSLYFTALGALISKLSFTCFHSN